MSDRGLGHFPIAGPKNSSSSLELCHAVFFLFFSVFFFCFVFFFLTLGTIKAAHTGALKENRGLASPQMSNHDMISPPLCNQKQSFPPDSWLALLGGYVYSQENQCQYSSNHASLPHVSVSVRASTPWHGSQIGSAWHHVHQNIYSVPFNMPPTPHLTSQKSLLLFFHFNLNLLTCDGKNPTHVFHQ